MKTFIVYGITHKFNIQATSKSCAKRRFTRMFPFDKIIYTQTKTK